MPGCCRGRRRSGRVSTAISSTPTGGRTTRASTRGRTHWALPGHRLRRAGDLARGRGAGGGGNGGAHRALAWALPRGAGGGDGAGQGGARGRDPLRLPLDPERNPLSFRWDAAGHECRDRGRGELRAFGRGGGAGGVPGGHRDYYVANGRFKGGWTASGTTGGPRGGARCADGAGAVDLPRRGGAALGGRPESAPAGCGHVCAGFSRRWPTWRPNCGAKSPGRLRNARMLLKRLGKTRLDSGWKVAGIRLATL